MNTPIPTMILSHSGESVVIASSPRECSEVQRAEGDDIQQVVRQLQSRRRIDESPDLQGHEARNDQDQDLFKSVEIRQVKHRSELAWVAGSREADAEFYYAVGVVLDPVVGFGGLLEGDDRVH